MNAIKFAIIGCAMITGIMRADGPPNEAFNDNELSRETQIRTAFIGLTPNQPKETIDKNLKVVVSGGVITLQVLVDEIRNKNIAHSSFEGTQNMAWNGDHDGMAFNKVTLGDVAFDLIQYLVEGKIPIIYRKHFLLTKDNAKEWLSARKGKTIEQLQIEAAKTSLERAAELESRNKTEYTQGMVRFFKKRLEILGVR